MPATLPSAPEPTDAELLAAVRRGIALGTLIEVTDDYLARLAAELNAEMDAPAARENEGEE